MLSITAEERRDISRRARNAKVTVPEAHAVKEVELLLRADSIDTIRALTERSSFLASDWVIDVVSSVRQRANNHGDDATAQKLSATINILSFLYEKGLRDTATPPPSLKHAYARWDTLASADRSNSAQVEEFLRLSRDIIASPDHDRLPQILRRDVYRLAAETLLTRYNTTRQAPDLDDAVTYFSDATRLCPDTSFDFARCMTYGGLALLQRYVTARDPKDLDTAITVLQYAVAAASDNPQPLLGQAVNGLTRAHVLRFELASDGEDIAEAAEIFTYGLSVVPARDEPLEPDTVSLAAAVSAALQTLPGESQRLAALNDAMEQAL